MNTNDQKASLPPATADGDAFGEFVKQYRKWLMVVALSILQDEQEARYVLQDIFIMCRQKKLYRKTGSSLKNTLYTSVRKACVHRQDDQTTT